MHVIVKVCNCATQTTIEVFFVEREIERIILYIYIPVN